MPKPTQKEPTPRQRVAAREQFIKRVVNFAIDFLLERGRVTEERQGSSNTHIVRHLVDFEGFSFRTDLGQTLTGGNTVVVWYHPGEEFGLLTNTSAKAVLLIDFKSDPLSFKEDHPEVKVFEEGDAWQTKIKYVMKNKKKILSKIATAQRRVEHKEVRMREQEAREKAFQDRAKRVRIEV